MKRIINWCKLTVSGFLLNHCSMHAAGLTYFALLAIVPILCVLLVAAKACGVDEYARKGVNDYLDAMITNVERGQDDELLSVLPQGDEKEREKKRVAAEFFAKQAREISNTVFERVEKFDISTFGWIGFGLLLWTVISSIGMVEVSFNEIWKVARPRPVWKRAYIYLLMALGMPVFAALAISPHLLNIAKNIILATLGATWLTKWAGDGVIWVLDLSLFRFAVSFVLSGLGFAVFFSVMPNCKVRFRCAMYGGLITAVLFCGWGKVCAVAQVGIAKSSALYGSFAFVPIVLAWMYMSWEIVLLGANMVHAFETAGGPPGRAGI